MNDKAKEDAHDAGIQNIGISKNISATIEVDTLELTRLILEGQNKTFKSLKSKKRDLSFISHVKAFQSAVGIQTISVDNS